MTGFTFNDCHELLRDAGYAPAAARGGYVLGPHRVHQIDYAQHVRPDDEAAVLCMLPPAHGTAAHVIADAPSTWLTTVRVVVADATTRARVLATIDAHAPGALVRVDGDTVTLLYRTGEHVGELTAQAGTNDDSVTVGGDAFITLGAPDDWRDGRTPLDCRRDALPELTADTARALIDAAAEVLRAEAPPPPQYVPPPPPPKLEDVKLERQNWRAVGQACADNGYYPVTLPWGDERPREPSPGEPALHLYLRGPNDRTIFFQTDPVDFRETWLISVSIMAGPSLAPEVEQLMAERFSAGRRLVLDNVDGSSTWLFQHDCPRGQHPFAPLTISRRRRRPDFSDIAGAFVNVRILAQQATVPVVSAEGTWRDGMTPLHVPRAELPVLDRNGADGLLGAIEALCEKPQPGIVERVKRKVARK